VYPHIYSFPRSGTTLLQAQIKRSFYPDDDGTERRGKVATGHWSQRYRIEAAPGWQFVRNGAHQGYSGQRGIYIVRDGRDVAISHWQSKTFQHPSRRALSFSEFLRRPLDWRITPGHRGGDGRTISEAWRDHVDQWRDKPGVCCVRYEDLLLATESVLGQIGKWLGREPVTLELVADPMGPDTHGGGVGKWRDVFSDGDLEYFFGIVPEDHGGLWIPREERE
jgi:hypothetical protein